MTAFGYDFNFVGPWWHSYETGGIDGGLEYYEALDSGNGHFAYLYHFQDLWLIALDFPVDWPDSSYEVSKVFRSVHLDHLYPQISEFRDFILR